MGKYIHGLSVEDRFWQKVEPEPNTGCWLWTGATRGSGKYGQFRNGKRQMFAHRYAYERFIGLVPEGLVLDHLCRTHLCVNPEHLQAVTNAENILRGESPHARNARATHCVHGHPLSGGNVYSFIRNGRPGRACIECHRKRNREWMRAYTQRRRMLMSDPKGAGRGKGHWTEKGIQAQQNADIAELQALVAEMAAELDALEAADTPAEPPAEPTPA